MVVTKICEQCKSEYSSKDKSRKFCSRLCGYQNKRRDVLFTCEECGEPKLRKGKEKNKRFCSRKCMLSWRSQEIKSGRIDLSRINKFGVGEKNPNWKGGVTPLHDALRRTKEYKQWRNAVYKRDNYTCVWCRERGGELNADHIKQFALYPELRLDISNGRTLCVDCHRKTFIFYKNQYKEGVMV